MDLDFFRRAEQRFASRTAAPLDFGLLAAMLQTQQSASPAARAQAQWLGAPAISDPLVELLIAGPLWRRAASAQRGCFNPSFARQSRDIDAPAFMFRSSYPGSGQLQEAVN